MIIISDMTLKFFATLGLNDNNVSFQESYQQCFNRCFIWDYLGKIARCLKSYKQMVNVFSTKKDAYLQ